MVYGFQQTAITPALPVIQEQLDASRAWTAWLFSGYLIVASVTPVFLGKLADRTGKRRVYLGSLTVFLVGSLGAALAPSIGLLVTCRVVQGVGGTVFPLSFSIARDELPPARLASGIGLLTGGFGFGSVGGFAIGGLIAQTLSWRWIFGVGAVALVFAVVLVFVAVPPSPIRTRRSLDTPGAALLGGAMTALIVAITEGPTRGWGSWLVAGFFALSATLAVAWVARELHTPEPLIDLRVLGARTVLLTNITSWLNGYSLFAINFLLPFLLVSSPAVTSDATRLVGLSAGPLLTGLVLLPRAFGQAFGGPVTGPLTRWIGQAPTFAAGMALMAAGAGGLALWRAELWHILVELAALGVGFGLSVSVSGAIVTRAVARGETGIATAITSVLRRLGGGVGAQVGAALITAITLSAGSGSGAPAPRAFTVAFLTSAGAALIGTVCAMFVRPTRRTR